MKAIEPKSTKAPSVVIDKELNKYDNVVLFPKKLAKANEMLAKSGVPGVPKKK